MTSLYEKFNEKQWELLEARAKRVERAVQQQETQQLIEVIFVRLRNESYALPVAAVMAVHEHTSLTRLPGAPIHIAGIANVRGQIVTVLDLGHILGVPLTEAESTEKALVLLSFDDSHTALLVDRVLEVTNITNEDLSPLPITDSHQQGYLRGVLENGTVLLDLETIISDPALIVDHS